MYTGFEFCIFLSVEIYGKKTLYGAFGDKRIHDLLIMLKSTRDFVTWRVGHCSARLTYLLLACNRD